MSEISLHRWPYPALAGELIRGVLAFGATMLLLLVTPVVSIAFVGLAGLAILFGLYLGGTVSRISSVVEVDDQGLRIRGGLFGSRAIEWPAIERFELRHFPLSRDRAKGWMDLKLKGGGRSISIDDKLERFDDVLARAWEAARAADVGVSDATHHNLVAAGLLATAKI
jgi:Bacterial PH domain